MKQDLIIAGVGGQGILTIAELIARSAVRAGLNIKQSEVHGMAQRGGAVVAHLRISSEKVHADLVPRGQAALILAVEPLEALRQLPYLGPKGWVVTNTTPVRNIDTYPPVDRIRDELRRAPQALLLDADALARQAGSGRTMNVVVLGAAAHALALPDSMLEQSLQERFTPKGDEVVQMNLRAFALGRQTASNQ
ncbi:MAG: indolepyruvate oxidoreductase subunit beta [Kiritimatiellaeota bacterium]|nr:indolepyruvate oxidoreductase subunit beta [Kiritimatiellota bacterium]